VPPASVLAIRPSNVAAFARIEMKWGWWRKPHRATLGEALSHTFNTTDPREGSERHAGFVHDSGRALFEMALPWLDAKKGHDDRSAVRHRTAAVRRCREGSTDAAGRRAPRRPLLPRMFPTTSNIPARATGC